MIALMAGVCPRAPGEGYPGGLRPGVIRASCLGNDGRWVIALMQFTGAGGGWNNRKGYLLLWVVLFDYIIRN